MRLVGKATSGSNQNPLTFIIQIIKAHYSSMIDHGFTGGHFLLSVGETLCGL